MLTPINPNQTPHKMWRFKHPETGFEIGGAFSLSRIIAMVNEYCDSNQKPRITDLPAKIVAYICEQEPDYCKQDRPLTFAERAVAFTSAMKQWANNGFRVVPQEVYEERLEICKACNWWRGQSNFGLGACGKCGCAGLKLYVPETSCPLNPKKWQAYALSK